MENSDAKKKFNRVEELKGYKKLANKILQENIELQKQQKPDWIHHTTVENIKSIKNIIKSINFDLSEKRLTEYCQDYDNPLMSFSVMMSQTNSLTFVGQICNYTIPGSITHDINWLTDFTVGEKFDIAFGKKSPGILAEYFPSTLQYIEVKVLPQRSNDFPVQVDLIRNALTMASGSSLIACNILLMTSIESIVRSFCKKLAIAQGLVSNSTEAEKLIALKQSMESVIKNIDWKNDVEMQTVELITEFEYVTEPEVITAKDTITRAIQAHKKIGLTLKRLLDKMEAAVSTGDKSDETSKQALVMIEQMQKLAYELVDVRNHKSLVGLKVFFHFLTRRFKDDRNALIHGSFSDLDTNWKTYVYLAGLKRLCTTIEMYKSKYHF